MFGQPLKPSYFWGGVRGRAPVGWPSHENNPRHLSIYRLAGRTMYLVVNAICTNAASRTPCFFFRRVFRGEIVGNDKQLIHICKNPPTRVGVHSYCILCSIQNLVQNPKSEIQNPKSEIQNPKSEIQNPKSKIQNLHKKKCYITLQNPKSEIQNPKSKIQNPESKIQNPKSQIQNPPPKSKIWGAGGLT